LADSLVCKRKVVSWMGKNICTQNLRREKWKENQKSKKAKKGRGALTKWQEKEQSAVSRSSPSKEITVVGKDATTQIVRKSGHRRQIGLGGGWGNGVMMPGYRRPDRQKP